MSLEANEGGDTRHATALPSVSAGATPTEPIQNAAGLSRPRIEVRGRRPAGARGIALGCSLGNADQGASIDILRAGVTSGAKAGGGARPNPLTTASPAIRSDSDGLEWLRAVAISTTFVTVSIIGTSSLFPLSVASIAICGFVCLSRPEASRFTKSSATSPTITHVSSPKPASLAKVSAGRRFVLDFTGRLRSNVSEHGAIKHDLASTGAG